MKYIIVVICILLCSCSSPTLLVRSSYYSQRNLASTVVDTPDPRKDTPYFGQRISMQWHIPASIYNQNPCELHIVYRLYNGEEKTKTFPLEQSLGEYILVIDGDDYVKKGGLLSYLVTILQDNKIIAESHHKFWVNKIIVDHDVQ